MSQNTISVMNQLYNSMLQMNQILRGSDKADKITAKAPHGGEIFGMGGNDSIDITGKTNIFKAYGGQGNDKLHVTYDDAKELNLFGGHGNDQISFGGSNNKNGRIGMVLG